MAPPFISSSLGPTKRLPFTKKVGVAVIRILSPPFFSLRIFCVMRESPRQLAKRSRSRPRSNSSCGESPSRSPGRKRTSRPLVLAVAVLWAILLVAAPFRFALEDPRALPTGPGARILFLAFAHMVATFEPVRVRRVGIGVLIGAAVGYLLGGALYSTANSHPGGETLLVLGTLASLGLGLVWGLSSPVAEVGGGRALDASSPTAVGSNQAVPKILDTSAIIDGRIQDVAESGFLEGIFIAPEFVLRELQIISDSPDPLKRTRGRRGLDILKRLRESSKIRLEIRDIKDAVAVAADERAIDARLVRAAKALGGALVTVDYNLNKVATLQGVAVLNINDLAGALKSILLPGEEIEITVQKEGKEPGQGIGYLEDGTMVIIDDAKSLMGRKARVIVTNLHQSSAGRMIFAKRI